MKNVLSNKAPIWIVLLISMLLAIVSACSPARKIIKQPLKEQGTDYIFGLLKKNELRYEWLSVKFSAKMEVDKKETSVNGQLRIHRDSAIWISFTALGFEAARILITQDSVKFLNRLDNTFLTTDYSFINNNLNSAFDFDMLQSLLVGNDLSLYENDKFKGNIDGGQYHLSTVGRRKLKKFIRNTSEAKKVLVQSLWLEPETGKITQVLMKELGKDNKKLETKYSVFETINNQQYPSSLEVSIQAEKNIRITLDFAKPKLDEPLLMPFSIPGKYSRIEQKK